MNIALILLIIGVMMVVAGYTNQISPQCDKDLSVKIVPRDVYDDIVCERKN